MTSNIWERLEAVAMMRGLEPGELDDWEYFDCGEVEDVSDLSAEDLEPCPFCGYDTHLTVSEVDAIEAIADGEVIAESPTFAVTCSFCGADGPESLSVDGARDAWNRRATRGRAAT